MPSTTQPNPATYTYADRQGDYTRQPGDQRLAKIEGVGMTYQIIARGPEDEPPTEYLVILGGGPAPKASVAAIFPDDGFMGALRWVTTSLEMDLA